MLMSLEGVNVIVDRDAARKARNMFVLDCGTQADRHIICGSPIDFVVLCSFHHMRQ